MPIRIEIQSSMYIRAKTLMFIISCDGFERTVVVLEPNIMEL